MIKSHVRILRKKNRANFQTQQMLDKNKIVFTFQKTNKHFYISILQNNKKNINYNTIKYTKANTKQRKSSFIPELATKCYNDMIQINKDLSIKQIYFNKMQYKYQGNIKIFVSTIQNLLAENTQTINN